MRGDQGCFFGRGDRAVLLLHAPGQTPEALQPLTEPLARGGLAVGVPALFQPGVHWSGWLRTARAAFLRLREGRDAVSVCALGDSAALALLLAEEYAPDQLLLAPSRGRHAALPERFALMTLRRRAWRGLFALEARPQILLPTDAAAARRARRLSRRLGACVTGPFPPEALAGALAACLGVGKNRSRPLAEDEILKTV